MSAASLTLKCKQEKEQGKFSPHQNSYISVAYEAHRTNNGVQCSILQWVGYKGRKIVTHTITNISKLKLKTSEKQNTSEHLSIMLHQFGELSLHGSSR